jgi:hypothetical protein
MITTYRSIESRRGPCVTARCHLSLTRITVPTGNRGRKAMSKWPKGFQGMRPKAYRGGRPRKVKPAPAPYRPAYAWSGSARLSGSSTLACGLPVRKKLSSRWAIDAFEHRARRREGARCYYVPVSEQTILTMIRRRSLEDSFDHPKKVGRALGVAVAEWTRCVKRRVFPVPALRPLPLLRITHAQRATRRGTEGREAPPHFARTHISGEGHRTRRGLP